MLALVFSVTSFLTATLLSAQTPAQRVLLLAPNFSGFCTAIAIAPPANANCLLSDFHWVPTPDNAPRLEGTVRLVPEIRVYCILPRNHPIRIDLDPDPLLRPYIELQVWRISNNEFKITLWHSEGMLEVHAIGATTLGGAGQDSRGEAAFSLAMRLTGQNSPLYACCRVIVSGVVQFPLFQGETRYLPDPEQELGLRCFGEHALGTCNEAKARKILDGRDTANNCSDFVSWDSHSEGQGVQ
ncbi:uncharacterized protein L969DRAFT_50112 [Mixia osmundae IAM 14324]|uniref:Uncharacterized protein n=1 Tax=Mixia osmundae (strain CBS 9802 / IAM 14324 / JCM 22182 / KY 12970) TaxID=764103 RepID=G7E0X7_MIXOS|nr:uncharacterized protein L969DRAFT_50112 [Mixia osmundae IAM 14324]KEI38879.1 hypothetical protein L969DRAFT_50112 [Mixia osmundae IAM 14324]GAA96487.1 hypothetical protein E5Q_03155 [Mixia osmundae IAM 14324]